MFPVHVSRVSLAPAAVTYMAADLRADREGKRGGGGGRERGEEEEEEEGEEGGRRRSKGGAQTQHALLWRARLGEGAPCDWRS